MPEAVHGPSVASQAPLTGKQGDYVGWQTCAGCHSAEAQAFARTPHAPGEASSTSPTSVTGCETCHGPGKAHAEAEEEAAGDAAKEMAGTKLIFSFHASPKENSERCMTCHITSQKQESFAHSQHAAAAISCNECHAAHLVKEGKDQSKGSLSYAQAAFFQVPQLPETVRWLHSSLLKDSEPKLCFTCHGNIQAQFALPVHHRVPEGLMKCTDCHNPHGSINRASLNATHWETCVKCHVEKRGPYVYEHAAVRVEGCVVCHSPHGNTNHFMLVRREGRQLCLQCHTGFHTQAAVPHSRLGYQTSGECTRCHVTIHGSELDPNFLR
jgi:predicted CXXCH cytochrome family protein